MQQDATGIVEQCTASAQRYRCSIRREDVGRDQAGVVKQGQRAEVLGSDCYFTLHFQTNVPEVGLLSKEIHGDNAGRRGIGFHHGDARLHGCLSRVKPIIDWRQEGVIQKQDVDRLVFQTAVQGHQVMESGAQRGKHGTGWGQLMQLLTTTTQFSESYIKHKPIPAMGSQNNANSSANASN